MKFSKEADVWSLGCILYELCTGTRAFANDFAVRDLESPEKLSINFVDGLGEKFKNAVQGQWIHQMLQRDYEKRPSAELLVKQFRNLVSSILPKATVDVSMSEMLGTDGPLGSSLPLWEEIFVPGSFQKQSALFDKYHRVFVTRCMLIGVEHPSVLWSALRLAWACMYRDEFVYSQHLFQLSLQIQCRTLGYEHHSVLTTRHGLARCLYDNHATKPSKEAVNAFEMLLDDQRRLLGANHPDTLQTRQRLAWALYHWVDKSKAFQELQEVLDKRLATLGPDHPQTIHTLDATGWFYWWSANFDYGVTLLHEVVAKQQRDLGMGHPLTVRSMACLAWCHHDQGFSNVPLLEAVLEAAERVLGPGSVYATSTRHRLVRLQELSAPSRTLTGSITL